MWGIWAIFFHGKSFVYVENIFFRSKFGEISPPKIKKNTLPQSVLVLHHLKITTILFYIILRLHHSWPILVANATMSICISNIYDDISEKSSKGWDEGDHGCTIVAYTPKKGAKIHCSCIKNLA
jgi:hypothetical protein